MIDILKTKFLLLARKPSAFIVITIIIGVFAYVLGIGSQGKQPVAVYSSLDNQQTEEIKSELEKLSDYQFTIYDKEKAIQKVEDGEVEVVIALKDQGFDLIVTADFMNAPLLQNELNTIYSEITQKHAVLSAYPPELQKKVTSSLEEAKINPSFGINYTNFSNKGEFIWDAKLHSLFGFTLFMVIYTIGNGVYHIVMERRNHIWDRLTVSAIKRSEVYIANLLYSFLLGYLQVVIILSVFYFGVGIDFYGGFLKSLLVVIPYLLCIVAICLFIASIAGTPGKFNAYISILAVPLAMLGGAYWPLEIVTSKVILALSYISPIMYGLELLNDVTLYKTTFNELIQPLGILLFMTVIFMGIGINVMEKKERI